MTIIKLNLSDSPAEGSSQLVPGNGRRTDIQTMILAPKKDKRKAVRKRVKTE
jgi:hypothetical protein